jgi:hypothetical protein
MSRSGHYRRWWRPNAMSVIGAISLVVNRLNAIKEKARECA